MSNPRSFAESADAGRPEGEPADAGAGERQSPLEELQTRLAGVEQERDQFLNLLQRTRADFENFQKRLQRELTQERRYAYAPLVLELLPVFDNLDRAMQAARQAKETGPLVRGVSLVQTQLLDVLKRHEIVRIEAQGRPFDPNEHQAVMQQPSADVPPGTVLQVLEEGFKIHERVLRPAKVIVSTAPGE
jgi:molecular chaperone GrpE